MFIVPASACDVPYEPEGGGNSYCYIGHPLTMSAAATTCDSLGYKLLTVRNEDEMNSLKAAPYATNYQCLQTHL